MNSKSTNFLPRLVAFIAVFCLIASLSAVNYGKLFGVTLTADHEDETEVIDTKHDVINTTSLTQNISGYAGPVPVEIHMTAGRIDSVTALPNAETPQFFAKLYAAGLPAAWNGMTLEEAADAEIDAVSGATYSSKAFIENVKAGANFALDRTASNSTDRPTAKQIAALIIILCGVVLPLFFKNQKYRILQQLLNVAVLGFWSGTFIDYAMMLNFFANGPIMTFASIMTVVLLAVGLIYPLFGHPQHYCAWICPMGSLQDLAGHISKKKVHLSPHVVKWLDSFRQILWIVLLILLYIGVGTAWIDYEIFTAFIVESASWIVIVAGIIFTILSIFIPRPFCRFICPTGSLLKHV